MTIVTLLADDRTRKALDMYARTLGLEPRSRYHTTVFYSEVTPLFGRKENRALVNCALPLIVQPGSYHLERFGESSLALCFESAEHAALRQALLEAAFRQSLEFPPREREVPVLRAHKLIREGPVYDLNPHVTLVTAFNGAIPTLPFTEPLAFRMPKWVQPTPQSGSMSE